MSDSSVPVYWISHEMLTVSRKHCCILLGRVRALAAIFVEYNTSSTGKRHMLWTRTESHQSLQALRQDPDPWEISLINPAVCRTTNQVRNC